MYVYMVHVCFYVCCSDCVGFCENVCCVAGILKDSVSALECLWRGCDVFVYCFNCEASSCRLSRMGSVRVLSCICCMFVSCVHPVAVLNAAFCMTCSLLMLVEDERGDHVMVMSSA